MKTVALGEIATFVRGVTFKPTDVTGDGVGVMRTKNVQETLDLTDIVRIPAKLVKKASQYLQPGDALISSANSWNLVGKACWVGEVGEPLAIGGFVTALRPDKIQIEPRYLYWWLTSPRTQATLRSLSNKTTSISNLNLKLSAQLPVPVPPREEQRRIAEILDQADAIRAKRRQVLAQFAALTQAIFHNAVSTTHNRCSLRDMGVDFLSGKNVLGGDLDGHPSNRVIKVSAMSSGRFDPSESKPMPNDYIPPESHRVRRGDILFGRASGSLALLGATAVVDVEPRNLYLPDKVWRLTIKPDAKVEPYFILGVLCSADARSFIRHNASGAAGVRNIAKSRLLEYEAPHPPLNVQRDFAARAGQINVQRELVQRALNTDNKLFASLQARAFKGEL